MEKYKTPNPLPTPFEAELLIILMEECAEVQKNAAKMLRFGVEDAQPGQNLTNRERLSLEVADVLAVLKVCVGAGLVEDQHGEAIYARMGVKLDKLQRYMQHGSPKDLVGIYWRD